MAQYTDHYNLTKPSGSENALISDINANMDILDDAIYDASQHGGITVGPEEPEEDLAWIDTDEEGADFCYVGDTEPTNDGSVAMWVDTNENVPIIKTLKNGQWTPCTTEARELLWTNPNPTRDFAGQTISIDLTNYDRIEILSKALNSSTGCQHFICDTISNGVLLLQMPADAVSSTNFRRRVATSTNTGVTFTDGYFISNVNNSSCVPIKIYGIKEG